MDNVPDIEKFINTFWEENDIYNKTLINSQDKPEWTFLDGPPFATGNPHHGHTMVSFIKDIMGRMKTMQGYHVTRRVGWDCHGLPAEMLANKQLNIKTNAEIEQFGIDKYNDVCRKNCMSCADIWQEAFKKMGRWTGINDTNISDEYRTLDTEFMQSIWWVFSELYKKDLIYQGYKVLPYSPACATALSNFEANQNYKEIEDLTICVGFKIINDNNSIFKIKNDYPSYLVAWTTTPWSLFSNMALCTGESINMIYFYD